MRVNEAEQLVQSDVATIGALAEALASVVVELKSITAKKAEELAPYKEMIAEISKTFDAPIDKLENLRRSIEYRLVDEHTSRTSIVTPVNNALYTVSFARIDDVAVTNADEVPREFLAVDLSKVREAIKIGIRSIPGVYVGKKAVVRVTKKA